MKTALSLLSRIAPVYFVPGNMDPPEALDYEAPGIRPLHGRVLEIGGYKIGGVGGSPPTPFRDLIRFTEEEISSVLQRLGRVDILVAHSPPRGILDRVGGSTPVGSTAVLKYVEENRPILSVHGHIHEDYGVVERGGTVFVNPGPLLWGQYAVAELGSPVRVELRRL